jgi:hypothetical protein
MASDTITNITALPTYLEGPAAAYLTQLQQVTGELKDADLSGQYGSQFVAGQDPLQAQAQQIAQQGIGAYQPYLQQELYKDKLKQLQVQLVNLLDQMLTKQLYVSISTRCYWSSTLQEYDIQAQKGLPALAQQAINAGAFGGGREGVQRAEYLSMHQIEIERHYKLSYYNKVLVKLKQLQVKLLVNNNSMAQTTSTT